MMSTSPLGMSSGMVKTVEKLPSFCGFRHGHLIHEQMHFCIRYKMYSLSSDRDRRGLRSKWRSKRQEWYRGGRHRNIDDELGS
jgi:hypothetical protein